MTTEYIWKNEPITEKLRRLIWTIRNIKMLISYDLFVIKRKNWMTEKEWNKIRQMTYKNVTKEILKQWKQKSKKLQKKWDENPHK